MRYCLVYDEDGEKYIIPFEKRDEFQNEAFESHAYWNIGHHDDPYKGTPPVFPPDWAVKLEGETLSFENPQIDGVEINGQD